jgi:hypothetical protein
MNLYIDCEFTSFQGQLMSMGIVADNGEEFYEVVEWTAEPHPWVIENVIPILIKTPLPRLEFQEKLYSFLKTFKYPHIIADWPDDIKYLMESLITGPGNMMNIASVITMEVHRRLSYISAIPHNALEDARGIKTAYLKEFNDN